MHNPGNARWSRWLGLTLVAGMGLALADSKEVFSDRFEPACFDVTEPTAALSWHTPDWQTGSTLTLSTDGSCAFGALGPELIILMDLTQMAPGQIDVKEIFVCDECDWLAGDTHEVEQVADLPGQRGLVMGGIGDAVNPTNTPRIRMDHPAYSRGFDSRITYWPEEHQEAAVPYLKGKVPGYEESAIWQIKPIWKMADADYGGGDTDFFLAGLYRWYSPGEYFLSGPTVSSNSVGTYYMSGGNPLLRSREKFNGRPFPEPYTIEYAWDQGSLTEAYDAFVDVSIATVPQGGLYKQREDDIRLHVVDGETKKINHFTYPGYIRGYSRTLGLHFYEAEIYRAGGDGAFARVALTDHPDYFSAGRRTLLQVLDWSETQVDVRLRNGWFDLASPDGAWIAIIDANNQQVASIRLD